MMPELQTAIPGPESLRLAQDLRRYESRNVTYVDSDWPIFWQRAEGANVWDVDGNRFLDLTSAFGVAGLGHGRAEIVAAMKSQADQLIHGMGDVHPTAVKAELCRTLVEMTWGQWGAGEARVILSNSGFEAVESALKTAVIATGKSGLIAFRNAYHGLGYGALLGTGMEKFREPFSGQLAAVRQQLDFPRSEGDLENLKEELEALDTSDIGALLVEPIQGRGGKVVPPDGFLKLLREWTEERGIVLIFDEIYTGFNRTGRLFACDWEGVVPDLICVGKAMSGGFPISACIGSAEIMDRWPESPGEALHTSTFLGNPVGCAMALQALELHREEGLADEVNRKGELLKNELRNMQYFSNVRGRGLMIGAELPEGVDGGPILVDMMKRGYLMLADGPQGNVLAFTPPFSIADDELQAMVATLSELISAS